LNSAEGGAAAPPCGPLFPLAAPHGVTPFLHQHRLDQFVLAFVLLGLAARCLRYLLHFPLWEDESFLCANLIDRDFRSLAEPLNFHQVGPLVFLWVQLAVVKLLGFSEWSLRLVPFLCGVGSLLLFWRLACRCLNGLPRLLAVAVFSVAYVTIRYSAEAKPYGVDLFVALALLTCVVNWLWRPSRTRWLWTLVAAIPLAVGLSYGAVLLGGGLCMAVALVICRQRRWECLCAWAAYTAALVGSFAVIYLWCIRPQEASNLEPLRRMWQQQFPPLTGLLDFVSWVCYQHTGDLLAYPLGGAPGQSSLSMLCCGIGLVALWRRKQWPLLALCLGPVAVTFVAAMLRRYPYGPTRLNLFLAPLFCIMIGYGMAVPFTWAARRGWKPGPWLAVALVLLASVAVGCMARDVAGPYKNICDQRARDFAEWFWYNAETQGEVACVKTDLGLGFSPDTYHELCFSAQYLCNQRIYSPRHAAGEPVHWDKISGTHPLCCVLYRCPSYRFDEAAYESWLRAMQDKYELVGRAAFPQVRLKNRGALLTWADSKVAAVDYIEVFHFVPKGEKLPRADGSSRRREGAKE
jgi:hypothetical protein